MQKVVPGGMVPGEGMVSGDDGVDPVDDLGPLDSEETDGADDDSDLGADAIHARDQGGDLPPVDPDSLGGSEGLEGYRGVTACAAAGITYRQLDYWARTGLVVPGVRDASGSGTQRLYSFRDIVVLKVVKRLLDAGVSLRNIRRAIETLRQWGEDELSKTTLISDGTTVYECRSAEEVVDLLQGGQGVFAIALGGAFREIQGSLSDLPAPGSDRTDLATASVSGSGSSPMDELAARRARRRAG
jgi:DNA-binding transcriptional MerR regulator